MDQFSTAFDNVIHRRLDSLPSLSCGTLCWRIDTVLPKRAPRCKERRPPYGGLLLLWRQTRALEIVKPPGTLLPNFGIGSPIALHVTPGTSDNFRSTDDHRDVLDFLHLKCYLPVAE